MISIRRSSSSICGPEARLSRGSGLQGPRGFAPHLISGVNSRVTVFARSQQGRKRRYEYQAYTLRGDATSTEIQALEGPEIGSGPRFDAVQGDRLRQHLRLKAAVII
jgi:hypothetical protein